MTSSTSATSSTTATSSRTAGTSVPVHDLLASRWSPRGFDRSHRLDDDSLSGLLEAARWAPSANNTQPWRFLVARRGDEFFDRLFGSLASGNQAWADAASALVLVAAETADSAGRTRPFALYDTGSAVAALTVQAGAVGLHVHQMAGFDAAAVRAGFRLDPAVQPVVVLAIGRHDPLADLPAPFAAREVAPRERKPLSQLLLDSNREDTLQAA